jgi:nucleoside-diphosphate-sugar epimerase
VKVAVVGAGGFIGTVLCRRLAAKNVKVLAVSSKAPEFDGESGLLDHALAADAEVTAVVYLSQSPRYREMPEHQPHLWSVNVLSAIRAAEWARRCGARRFVYASTGNVYAPSFDPHRENDPVRRDSWYPLSKMHAEEALTLHAPDLSITCARLFGVYGPQQRGRLVPNLIDAVRSGHEVRLHPHPFDAQDRNGVRLSLTYVDDAADALCHLALTSSPAVVNVAGGEVCSIRDLAETIGGYLGRTPTFVWDTEPREGNLIADTSRLTAIWNGTFRSLRDGLHEVIAGHDLSVPKHA